MIHTQAGIEGMRTENRSGENIGFLTRAGKLVRLMAWFAAAVAIVLVSQPATAAAKKLDLPYATNDHPQFIPASQATFLHPNDLLIGVTDGQTAKAYPAAILAQHGVVQDQMPDAPIAITW